MPSSATFKISSLGAYSFDILPSSSDSTALTNNPASSVLPPWYASRRRRPRPSHSPTPASPPDLPHRSAEANSSATRAASRCSTGLSPDASNQPGTLSILNIPREGVPATLALTPEFTPVSRQQGVHAPLRREPRPSVYRGASPQIHWQ